MKQWLIALLGMTLGSFAGLASAQAITGSSAPLDCSRGPVSETYGAASWWVYACSDQRSVVLMSAPGSPAAPFYFMFSADGSRYRLSGEGTGSKAITDQACQELTLLSEAQIQQLFVLAASAAAQKNPALQDNLKQRHK